MAVSPEKSRILVTVTKEQKALLDRMADQEKRSLSNLCAKIITDHLDSLAARAAAQD